MIKKLSFLLFLAAAFQSVLGAELHFSNGDRLTGKLLRIGPEHAVIELPYGTWRVRRADITAISFQDNEPKSLFVRLPDGSVQEGVFHSISPEGLQIFQGKNQRVFGWKLMQEAIFIQEEKEK